jgi:hypothetical protein
MMVSVPDLHLWDASRHGRVEHPPALCAHPIGEFLAFLRADGAHVDPRLPGDSGEDAVRPRRDLLKHAVIGDGGEDDVGLFCHLPWCVAPAQAFLEEVLGVFAAPLLAVNGVASGEESHRHAPAHVTKADEADSGACGRPWHDLPRSSHGARP